MDEVYRRAWPVTLVQVDPRPASVVRDFVVGHPPHPPTFHGMTASDVLSALGFILIAVGAALVAYPGDRE
jgi:hypothetical protein